MSMTFIARIGAVAVPMIACVVLLASCGGGGGDTAPQPASQAQPSGAPPSTGGEPSRQVSTTSTAPQVAAGPLDTSGWLLPPPFYAGGEEPYWRLEIIDGWFVFRRSGLPEIEAPMVQPTRTGDTDVFDAPPLKLAVRRGACANDGGEPSQVSVVMTFDDIEYAGCAYPGAAGGAASTDAERVARSIASIDACLARLAEPALITGVYPREGDRTAFGMRTRNGSLFECAAESGGEIAFLDPVEPGVAAAWMTSRMRFLRQGVADGVSCPDGESVRAGDETLGVLLSAKCRF